MKKQIEFFMAALDEANFMDLLRDTGCEIDESSPWVWFFCIGTLRFQFLRSRQMDDAIVRGGIDMWVDRNSDHIKAARKLYRNIMAKFESEYSNRLIGRNVNTKGSETPIDRIWVGPEAQTLSVNDGKLLRQSTEGFIVYEIQQ